jgi:ribosomal protein S18 acetylase RimI-like enzyme
LPEDLQQPLEFAEGEPTPDETPDWRFHNAHSLRGASLMRRAYRNLAPGVDHGNCTGCWAKFLETAAPDALNEGYTTYTESDWLCGSCFEDLKTPLDLKLAPDRMARLLESGVTIHQAHVEDWIPDVRQLFVEYAQSLGIDLGFQDFDRELAELPGQYNRTLGKGSLLVAAVDGRPGGVVACRPWEGDICEMKRLYVRPEFRGSGLGEALARAIIDDARALGYRAMRLDTLPGMESAQRLYEGLGFRPIAPYRANPIAGTVYLELALVPDHP